MNYAACAEAFSASYWLGERYPGGLADTDGIVKGFDVLEHAQSSVFEIVELPAVVHSWLSDRNRASQAKLRRRPSAWAVRRGFNRQYLQRHGQWSSLVDEPTKQVQFRVPVIHPRADFKGAVGKIGR
jgi:hypothetical protein